MIFEAHTINAEHKDLIHDVAYDFYGQRMATCSSDQFVKVSLLPLLCRLNEVLYETTKHYVKSSATLGKVLLTLVNGN